MRLGTCVAAALLCVAAPALAWDNQGHMATGAIAYDTLRRTDPAMLRTIVAIMRAHPDHVRFDRTLGTLTGAARDRRMFELMARWPDDIRDTAYDRADWHYAVKVVSGWTAAMPLTFGKAIDQFSTQLALAQDTRAPAAERAVALCWVFHLVGDMHQPLHAGHRMSWRFPRTDRSGTIGWVRTAPGATPVTLHEFWDDAADRPGTETAAAEALALRSEQIVATVSPPGQATVAAQFDSWVAQSRQLSATIVYRGAALEESDEPSTAPVLPAAYRKAARDLAERRIGEAGIHLAGTVAGLRLPGAAVAK